MRGRPSIFPCGMATPLPKPVDPSCSRSTRLARIAAESSFSRWPARWASCCSKERLFPPGSEVLIASKSRKSLNSIQRLAESGPGLSGIARLDPADIPVFAPVYHVELARAAVLEHQSRGVAQVHQHDGVGHAGFGNIDAAFGDDRRVHGRCVLCRRRENRV